MRTIEIDDHVYCFIQSRAIPYEDKCPNDTLSRLFGINKVISNQPKEPADDLNKVIEEMLKNAPNMRRRSPPADLSVLIVKGLASEGEPLTLVDYRHNRLLKDVAVIKGKKLLYRNELFSMSELAKRLLKEHGFSSDSVRGPAHWINARGESIKDLWAKYLANTPGKDEK